MGIPPQVPPVAQPTTRFQRAIAASYEHAEIIASIVFAISLAIWVGFIPRESVPYVEKDLQKRAATSGPDQSHYLRDLEVWNQYEADHTYFKWGVDFNLYMYASLKTLAIILSAITPALIVAPSLKEKKVLAALPAVVVAVATGLIGEFDFKTEAARFDNAQVQLQTEKSMFVTAAGPFYSVSPCQCLQTSTVTTKTTNSTEPKGGATVPDLSIVNDLSDAPFLPPHAYDDARANFAYRIERIRQAVASERDQFLRGRNQQAGTPEIKQRANAPNPNPNPKAKSKAGAQPSSKP
jgi:hypothetical protein